MLNNYIYIYLSVGVILSVIFFIYIVFDLFKYYTYYTKKEFINIHKDVDRKILNKVYNFFIFKTVFFYLFAFINMILLYPFLIFFNLFDNNKMALKFSFIVCYMDYLLDKIGKIKIAKIKIDNSYYINYNLAGKVYYTKNNKLHREDFYKNINVEILQPAIYYLNINKDLKQLISGRKVSYYLFGKEVYNIDKKTAIIILLKNKVDSF